MLNRGAITRKPSRCSGDSGTRTRGWYSVSVSSSMLPPGWPHQFQPHIDVAPELIEVELRQAALIAQQLLLQVRTDRVLPDQTHPPLVEVVAHEVARSN